MKCRRPACKNNITEGKVYCSGECRAEHKRRMAGSAAGAERKRQWQALEDEAVAEHERRRKSHRPHRLADAIFPDLPEWERDLMFEDLMEEIEERIRQ